MQSCFPRADLHFSELASAAHTDMGSAKQCSCPTVNSFWDIRKAVQIRNKPKGACVSCFLTLRYKWHYRALSLMWLCQQSGCWSLVIKIVSLLPATLETANVVGLATIEQLQFICSCIIPHSLQMNILQKLNLWYNSSLYINIYVYTHTHTYTNTNPQTKYFLNSSIATSQQIDREKIKPLCFLFPQTPV